MLLHLENENQQVGFGVPYYHLLLVKFISARRGETGPGDSKHMQNPMSFQTQYAGPGQFSQCTVYLAKVQYGSVILMVLYGLNGT